ncbi:CDGSH iron-sulfur domain-containing protein [Candidatus Peregrinibacteria bacterium]|nr:CDGSH iron-sulfur domain-containing protein [Candidatus Peregrinibacteria bacterium]
MPRLVQHNSHGPKQVGNPKDNLWICQCGLAKTQPFCDGSHKLTLDESEEKLYQYDANLQRKELPIE